MKANPICRKSSQLWIYFVLIVFCILFVTFSVPAIIVMLLYKHNLLSLNLQFNNIPVIMMLSTSMVIGTLISMFVGHKILSPITNLSQAFRQVAKGDFSARLSEKSKISEISEIYENFNFMVHELSGIETLRNDFVVSVSHEFKTPIAAIEGYATLLQGNSITEEQHSEYVEKIIANSQRLAVMSGNILNLSRLENQEIITDKKNYRIDEQIRKAVLMLESMWSPKNIEFDINMPKLLYYGSESLLYQVWYNLISNAIKYSYEGGIIAIEIMASVGKITAIISDSGCGISRDVQKHIFEKFYQGDSTRKSDGNGLGLALVKRIVDLCNGKISVESEPDKGASFTVILPREYL